MAQKLVTLENDVFCEGSLDHFPQQMVGCFTVKANQFDNKSHFLCILTEKSQKIQNNYIHVCKLQLTNYNSPLTIYSIKHHFNSVVGFRSDSHSTSFSDLVNKNVHRKNDILKLSTHFNFTQKLIAHSETSDEILFCYIPHFTNKFQTLNCLNQKNFQANSVTLDDQASLPFESFFTMICDKATLVQSFSDKIVVSVFKENNIKTMINKKAFGTSISLMYEFGKNVEHYRVEKVFNMLNDENVCIFVNLLSSKKLVLMVSNFNLKKITIIEPFHVQLHNVDQINIVDLANGFLIVDNKKSGFYHFPNSFCLPINQHVWYNSTSSFFIVKSKIDNTLVYYVHVDDSRLVIDMYRFSLVNKMCRNRTIDMYKQYNKISCVCTVPSPMHHESEYLLVCYTKDWSTCVENYISFYAINLLHYKNINDSSLLFKI